MTKNYGAPNVSTVEAEKALSVGVGGVIAEQCRGGGGVEGTKTGKSTWCLLPADALPWENLGVAPPQLI